MMSATISVYLNNSINSSMMRQSLHSSMVANRILQQQSGKNAKSATRSTSKSKQSARKTTAKASKTPKSSHSTGTVTPNAATSFKAAAGHLLSERMAEKLAKNEEDRKKMATVLHQSIVVYENQAMSRQGVSRFSDLWNLERIVSDAIAMNYAVYKDAGVTKPQFDRVRASVGSGMYSGPVCQDTEQTFFKLGSASFKGSSCLVPK